MSRRAAPADLRPVSTVRHLLREAEAITGGTLAVLLLLAFVSYDPSSPAGNFGGRLGHGVARVLLDALGIAAYLFPVYLAFLAVSLLRETTNDLGGVRLAGAGVLVASVAALAGLLGGEPARPSAGGWLGGFLGYALLRDLLGGPGATLMLAVCVTTGLVLATGVSALEVAGRVGRWLAQGGRAGAGASVALLRRLTARRAMAPTAPALPEGLRPQRPGRPIPLDEVVGEDGGEGSGAPPAPPATGGTRGPEIVREAERKPEPGRKGQRRASAQEELFADESYRLPPLSLLDQPPAPARPLDDESLQTRARILEAKLADFGVLGTVTAVRPGPVITTFEFEPAPGVKVSRIVNLADDLLMAMRAASVRILAPIPGKAVVGVEVSNVNRETVYIREILHSEPFRRAESKLTLALGKTTTGDVKVADLAAMPHLLIAGATGTGKSVSMNAMILSILYKSSPRDVRMILIDPKMLELSVYEHIPHLLVPVVTNPKKAAAALANMVSEMEERYRLLHDKGVRSLDSYNRLVAQEAAAAPAPGDPLANAEEEGALGEPPAAIRHRHLPRIVVVIDELADLMMMVGHEIEESITRLAQKARAAGIHLILATQRPSVDVITGLIKANFPARISFQVTSGTNSRTILDCVGAERLLGSGDMLFLPPGTARVERLHGPFVSDQEVHRVVDFIKRQEQPLYEMGLLEGGDEEDEGGPTDEEEVSDELYDRAVHEVTTHRQASISWLQRRLRVGYNRAARMIERMEREGVVSPPLGPKGREVIARKLED